MSAIGWNGVYLAEIARITPPAEVGRITGGSLFFTFGGVLVGPSAFAALYHAFGSLGATFGLLAGAALAGLVLVVAAQRGNAVTGPAPRA